jgi:hypothetical protein
MNGGHGHAVLVNALPAPMPGASRPPAWPKGQQRRCRVSTCGCVSLILVTVVLVAAAVLVPLFVTGVIKVGKPRGNTVRRVSYDPLFYGNLHPYLYPNERAQFGVNTQWDVIVIGAGVAGLAAATALHEEGGLNVLVLEARVRLEGPWHENILLACQRLAPLAHLQPSLCPRAAAPHAQDQVGGRVLSVPFGQRSVELGAQWMSGVDGNPLSPLATTYAAPRALTSFASKRAYTLQGTAFAAGEAADAGSALAAFQEGLAAEQAADAAGAASEDRSVAAVIETLAASPGAAAQLRQSLATPLAAAQHGADLAQLSSMSFGADAEMPGPAALSMGGMQRIPRGLAAALNATGTSRVLLGRPVASVRVGDLNATVVEAGGREHTAQFVICTAPLGVLQSGALAFHPPLPADTAGALRRLGVGLVNAVHLRFTQASGMPFIATGRALPMHVHARTCTYMHADALVRSAPDSGSRHRRVPGAGVLGPGRGVPHAAARRRPRRHGRHLG